MWRPENFYTILIEKYPAIARELRESSSHVEAVADAMLEALKEGALIRRITLPAYGKLTNDLSDFELTSSGWLVFIPDEGNDTSN